MRGRGLGAALVLFGMLTATCGVAEARVVVESGWEGVTAEAIPSGWSRQTVEVPSSTPFGQPTRVEGLGNGQFLITFGIARDHEREGAGLGDNKGHRVPGGQILHLVFDDPPLDAREIAGRDGQQVVAIGDSAWGVVSDSLAPTPVVTSVVRQLAGGIASASAQPLPGQAGRGDLDWTAPDAALRELALSIDGWHGPDPAQLDTSQNAAGLAALTAAWRASRGKTTFTITRTSQITSGRTVLFHDQAHRIHGTGSTRLGQGFHVEYVYRAGGYYSWQPIRAPGGCFYREARAFPASMRVDRLFGDMVLSSNEGAGDALTWPDYQLWFLPPAYILDPAEVGRASGLVFKAPRVVGGKLRIEYLRSMPADRLRVIVRLAHGRIEAVRTERSDPTGKLLAWQSIRIAYSVDPALAAARPVCTH